MDECIICGCVYYIIDMIGCICMGLRGVDWNIWYVGWIMYYSVFVLWNGIMCIYCRSIIWIKGLED